MDYVSEVGLPVGELGIRQFRIGSPAYNGETVFLSRSGNIRCSALNWLLFLTDRKTLAICHLFRPTLLVSLFNLNGINYSIIAFYRSFVYKLRPTVVFMHESSRAKENATMNGITGKDSLVVGLSQRNSQIFCKLNTRMKSGALYEYIPTSAKSVPFQK